MALVGGLVLGLSAAFQSGRPEGTSSAARCALRSSSSAGRIAGYTVLRRRPRRGRRVDHDAAAAHGGPDDRGGASSCSCSAPASPVSRRGWRAGRPRCRWASARDSASADGGAGAYSDTRAATLGAASFFLPCGFTQAIQIFALSTGSPLFGAALLGAFAIGTAPGLLALAGLPLVVPSRAKPTLMRLVGVVVIGFALLNGSAGLRLSGFTLPSLVGVANAAPLPGTLGADGIQRITTLPG